MLSEVSLDEVFMHYFEKMSSVFHWSSAPGPRWPAGGPPSSRPRLIAHPWKKSCGSRCPVLTLNCEVFDARFLCGQSVSVPCQNSGVGGSHGFFLPSFFHHLNEVQRSKISVVAELFVTFWGSPVRSAEFSPYQQPAHVPRFCCMYITQALW